jgi:hypothetical protein
LRHGAYHETRLTPAVVRGGLHKLAELKLPGDAHGMDAQPLFAAGVSINGHRKDLILCATLANRIHAFDCATYKQVWMTDVGKSVLSTNKIDFWGTNQHFGIMSTPEIVDDKLYVVAWISPDATREKAAHFLHELRLSDGKVLRKLKLPGASTTVQRKQRASLASSKTNGKRTLFVPFGTIQETAANAHGFITAVDIDSFTVSDELNLTKDGSGAGVWMAGQAPTVLVEPDASGRQITYLVLMTGNGNFEPAKGNFAECFVKARFDGTFAIVDWWSPWLDDARGGNGWDDMDLASAGPIVIPELGLVLGAGKDFDSVQSRLAQVWASRAAPTCRTIRPANYGRLKTEPVWFGFFPGFGVSAAPNDPKQLNKLFFNKTHHQHGSPIYWPEKKLMYTWCENGNLRVGEVQPDGKWKFLARSEEVASPYSPVPPGGMPGGNDVPVAQWRARRRDLWGACPTRTPTGHRPSAACSLSTRRISASACRMATRRSSACG